LGHWGCCVADAGPDRKPGGAAHFAGFLHVGQFDWPKDFSGLRVGVAAMMGLCALK
jgi:hypothetical protein